MRAESAAEAVLNASGRKIPVDLVQVIRDQGISLKSLDGDFSGKLDRQSKTIYVNMSDNPARKSFTVAHELGHYLLHDCDDVLYRGQNYSNDPKELEANEFAACLLMPRKEFVEAFEALGGNLNSIAEHFGVSRPAVAFRADRIGGVCNEYD